MQPYIYTWCVRLFLLKLRVSALMSNAPIILTLDCDMISNDPSTPHKMLCYFMDKSVKPNLGYVQFPVRFHGINNDDTYASEFKRVYYMNPMGMNGLLGPDYFGTGTFFNRRVFYGGPSSMIEPRDPQLSPDYVVKKHMDDEATLELAHHVASCDYEKDTNWGSKVRQYLNINVLNFLNQGLPVFAKVDHTFNTRL